MGKTSKVVICGMRSVGKTAILEQLIYGSVSFATKFYPTIEDIYTASIETDRGTKEKFCFYDTAGLTVSCIDNSPSSTYHCLPKDYMTSADGYVLVYDICKPESLTILMTLYKDIEKNKDKKEATTIVLGNRTGDPNPDLLENTVTKAANWCTREKLKHFEICAMNRSSLYEAFIFLSSKLNPIPTKTAFPQLPALTKLTQKGIIRTDS